MTHILVVEDDPDSQRLLVLQLRRAGYEVQAAGTVEEAMDIFDSSPVDCVISDLRLPDASGIDLMKTLSDRGPIRAIALTGSAQRDDIGECLRAGFKRYLAKPVDFAELKATLAEM